MEIDNLSASSVRLSGRRHTAAARLLKRNSVRPSGERPSPNLIYSTRDRAQPPAPLFLGTAAAAEDAAAAAAAVSTRSHTDCREEGQVIAELWCHHPMQKGSVNSEHHLKRYCILQSCSTCLSNLDMLSIKGRKVGYGSFIIDLANLSDFKHNGVVI